MTDSDRVAVELADAATVHAVREEIVRALGPLAARPLDEQAVAAMRRALARADSPVLRRALGRLAAPFVTPDGHRPRLMLVCSPPAGAGEDLVRFAPLDVIPGDAA